MAIDDIDIGDEILAQWGQAVADFLNARTSIATATGNIGTSETQVVGLAIAADQLVAGATYILEAHGTAANSSGADRALTIRCRIGTTTLAGNVAGSRAPNIKDGAASEGFLVRFHFTVRTAGASGTCLAGSMTAGQSSNPLNTPVWVNTETSTVAVDTTVANVLEITAQTANAGATANFRNAAIYRVV